jgi:hypothetical protein
MIRLAFTLAAFQAAAVFICPTLLAQDQVDTITEPIQANLPEWVFAFDAVTPIIFTHSPSSLSWRLEPESSRHSEHLFRTRGQSRATSATSPFIS